MTLRSNDSDIKTTQTHVTECKSILQCGHSTGMLYTFLICMVCLMSIDVLENLFKK